MIASDLVTWRGFFILLQPEWEWYFFPLLGIHTISATGAVVGGVVGLVVGLVVGAVVGLV